MVQLPKTLKSFRYAWQGIVILFKTENNAKFHLIIAILAVVLGFYLNISNTEWAIILVQIGLVLSSEAINTAIEKLCDYVSPEHQQLIGKVKDLAAAGVLFVAITAFIVGIIIFLPKLLFFN